MDYLLSLHLVSDGQLEEDENGHVLAFDMPILLNGWQIGSGNIMRDELVIPTGPLLFYISLFSVFNNCMPKFKNCSFKEKMNPNNVYIIKCCNRKRTQIYASSWVAGYWGLQHLLFWEIITQWQINLAVISLRMDCNAIVLHFRIGIFLKQNI